MLAGEGASGSKLPFGSGSRQLDSARNRAPKSAAAGTNGDNARVTTPAEGRTAAPVRINHPVTILIPLEDTINYTKKIIYIVQTVFHARFSLKALSSRKKIRKNARGLKGYSDRIHTR